MLRRLCTLAVPVIVLASASNGLAATVFTIPIENSQEPGTVTPMFDDNSPRSSFGTATFTINDANNAMSMVAEVHGIDFFNQTPDVRDNLINAHIHAGDAVPPNTNPVVWGFIGAPDHNTAPSDTVITQLAAGVGFNVTATWNTTEGSASSGGFPGQLSNIQNSKAYINFHTQQYPGGEIRGILPEPASVAGLLAI